MCRQFDCPTVTANCPLPAAARLLAAAAAALKPHRGGGRPLAHGHTYARSKDTSLARRPRHCLYAHVLQMVLVLSRRAGQIPE